MKILHVVPSLSLMSGGPSFTVPSLCSHLANLNLGVRILTVDTGSVDETYKPRQELSSNTVSVKAVSCIGSTKYRMIWSPSFPLAMQNELLSFKPDLVHIHGIWRMENYVAARSAMHANIPIMYSLRGAAKRWAMEQKRLKKKIAWKIYQERDLKYASVLHATAEREADDLRQLGLTQPIALIPNGIERFMPGDVLEDNSQTARELRSNRTILFMSRVHPGKGVDMLIDAWSSVRRPGWRCHVVGPGDDAYKSEMKERAKARGVGDDFAFFDMAIGDEKWRRYREAEIFILPTSSENFGMVVAEALSAGVPVITTKGAPWRALQEQRCGWWVSVETNAVATAMQEAMDLSDAERREMGERGRRFVEAHYAWSKVAEKMADVYRWVCGQGEKPACIQD